MDRTKVERAAVLVTGGRGFIGAHLVPLLSRQGREVISVDIADATTDSHGTPGVHEVVADVRDRAAIASLLKSYGVDTVYDLASFTDVGLSAATYRRNVDQTRSMVDCVKESAVRRYVFFSTQFVFRKPDRLPASHEDYAPGEEYGASKVASERLIRESLPPGQWLIVRPTYIWGPGRVRFRDGLLYRLAKGQFMIPNDRSIRRYYGYVGTVVRQATALAEMPSVKLAQSVYYVSEDAIHLSELCSALIGAMGTGRAIEVHSAVIRTLGRFGDSLERIGMRAPISLLQARELTTNYPIPLDRTLSLVGERVELDVAARETVRWAMEDCRFRLAVKGKTQ
jgi:nucleoside-diphosphate-sugar epimerase